MKRMLLLALLLVAGTAAAAGARPQGGAPEPIASNGAFSVCMDVSFPPMEYYPKPGSSTPVGFDVDLAKAVAKRWGVKIKFVPTAFTGLLPALQAEKCDVVWSGIFVTPDRTKQFPAVGYMKTHRALLVRAGNPERITSPTSLAGKTVATEAGTKYVDALKALDKSLKARGKKGLNIQTYPKASDAVAALAVGRCSAVLTQDTEAAFRITQQKGKFKIAYLYPQSDTFGVYYRKSDNEVGPALRGAVKGLKANGVLRRLAKKHNLPLGDLGLKG
jgi:polar amino acid transport system substrate-binding protein